MRLNLQNRLVVFLLIPAALINLSTFLWAFVYSRERLIEQWIQGANARLEYAADRIGCGLGQQVAILKAIQQAENAPQKAVLQTFLFQLLRSTPGVRLISVRTVDDGPKKGNDRPGLDFRINTERNFFEVVSKHLTPDNCGYVKIDIAIRFAPILTEIRKLHLWRAATSLLVTSDGLCLASSEPHWVNRRLRDFHNPLILKVLNEMKDGRTGGTIFGEGRPPDLVAGFRQIPNTQWYLVLYEDGCEICQPMLHFRTIFLMANIASLMVVLLLIGLVKRPIVRSIEELSESAKQVEEGNYSTKVMANRSDEIGQLQRRVNKMIEGLRQRDLIQRLFGRYVGRSIAAELLKNAENLNLGGQEKTVTILMADLRGFTSMAEKLKPTEVVRLLNKYLSRMTETIENSRGVVIDFYGDGILAFFDGADSNVTAHALDAVDAAMRMQRTLLTVSQENRAEELPELSMGIGIHTGLVVVGNIGSEKRGKYGVVGSAVNTAKRIESIAERGVILMSDQTYSVLGGRVEIVRELQVKLKGLEGTRELFELAWSKEPHVSTVPRSL
ncbi:MAG: adenylate/guanylate cyclase domain-containing protein [Desulfomonilaceae bacterium]